MANQKITDLNKHTKLTGEDLFIVVDKDEYGTSPTGETKAISAKTLAEQLAEIKHSDVGIRFSELADVPNEYIESAGSFVKINDTGDGVDFTESPGHSEITVKYEELFQSIESNQVIVYRVGDVLMRDPATNTYKHASSDNPDSAEVVGVIRKIKKDIEGDIVQVNIAFGGHVVFEEPVHVEKSQIDNTSAMATESVLVGGKTYFLGRIGKLSDYDPSIQVNDSDPHISKPLLVATGPQSGIFVNYRGLLSEKTDEPHKFVVEYSASCSKIKVGDIVRVRRRIKRNVNGKFGSAIENADNAFDGMPENIRPAYLDFESGESPYVLANSASQDAELAYEDAYACEFIGIVTIASSDYFQIQTSGMITFDMPASVISDDNSAIEKSNAIFKRGYTYYLESFDITSDQNTNVYTKRLRRTLYDYSTDEINDYYGNSIVDSNIEDVVTGISPFRNTTINNPFARDPETQKVTSYAKPVFYAVSENQILLLNHATYPMPFDACNAVNPIANQPCKEFTQSKSFTMNESLGDVNEFLGGKWSDANKGDTADVQLINFSESTIKHQVWKKVEENSAAGVWQMQEGDI